MIIITGGAGFIGSNLIYELNQQGEDDILVVDRLGKGEKWRNLVGLKFREYLEAEPFWSAVENGNRPTRKPEFIIHLGACSSTTETDMDYLWKNNLMCSEIAANIAHREGARLLVASSAATYGDGAQGFSDDHAKLDGLRPLNPYGMSKHMFDLWALRSGILDKITVMKFFNVFGPNEYHKGGMRSFVLQKFEEYRRTGAMSLFANPDGPHPRRDFLYVKDACRMVIKLMQAPPCGIVNLGTGQARSFEAVAGSVFAALDRPVNIKRVQFPESLIGRYQNFTQADMTKYLQIDPGFAPTPLEDAVRDYVGYLRGHLYRTEKDSSDQA